MPVFERQPSQKLKPPRLWVGLTVLFLLPIFISACVSMPTPRQWVDPDFEGGLLPLSQVELLPLSLRLHLDQIGAASQDELRAAYAKVATQMNATLRGHLREAGYLLQQGQMPRMQLYHVLSEVEKAIDFATEKKQAVGIDPLLVAGGIPGTDAVMLIDSFVNLTSSGKRAAQVTVVILLVAVVVLLIAFAIASAASAGKGGGKGLSGLKAPSFRGSSVIRSPRGRTFLRSPIPNSSIRPNFYSSNFRYRGRPYSYEAPLIRPFLAVPQFIFYSHDAFSPFDTSLQGYQPPEVEKPGFFSTSYADLRITILHKTTGQILWHHDARWQIDATDPASINRMAREILRTLPPAKAVSGGMAPLQPSNPPPTSIPSASQPMTSPPPSASPAPPRTSAPPPPSAPPRTSAPPPPSAPPRTSPPSTPPPPSAPPPASDPPQPPVDIP